MALRSGALMSDRDPKVLLDLGQPSANNRRRKTKRRSQHVKGDLVLGGLCPTVLIVFHQVSKETVKTATGESSVVREPAQSETVKRLEQDYQRLTRTQSYNEVEERTQRLSINASGI